MGIHVRVVTEMRSILGIAMGPVATRSYCPFILCFQRNPQIWVQTERTTTVQGSPPKSATAHSFTPVRYWSSSILVAFIFFSVYYIH